MLANTAYRMLQELHRSTQDEVIPDYDSEAIQEVIRECQEFYDLNQRDLSKITDLAKSSERAIAVQFRHHTLLRNRRCLMAYFYKRIELIEQLRLEFGTILPVNVRSRLSSIEQEF
ncbi:hypothetical protein GJ496_009715 [Pomphorhynchus laevis]|nr:hypothetical protein GJ496_009715 [Pomphorhynchus laevis]